MKSTGGRIILEARVARSGTQRQKSSRRWEKLHMDSELRGTAITDNF